MTPAETLAHEIDQAEHKAIVNLARYKFANFGYWAGIWVHLNKIEGKRRPNPFRSFVNLARTMNQARPPTPQQPDLLTHS